MKLSIIIIGDEILLGQVADTNSRFIASHMTQCGWQVLSTAVVGDDAEQIRQAVDRALGASDLVITTGGLGPTKDDITRGVLMARFGGELREDAEALRNVERVFARRGLVLNDLTRSQALVPSSCQPIPNRLGTAPGMLFRDGAKALVAMPGVPFETEAMLTEQVIPAVNALFQPEKTFLHHTLIVKGITESDLAERLSAYEWALPPRLHLAYLPNPGYIRLRLDGAGLDGPELRDAFAAALASLREQVADVLIHDGDATPAEILLEMLRSRHLTLATAESCTGGNVAHAITAIPGSSDVFQGSVVSYANAVKSRLLGVAPTTLSRVGAVSQEVAMQMAQGVCYITGADCSVATTGIAGPGGGTPDKPVGTVWIAASYPGADGQRRTDTKELHLPGDRARVIDRATTEALLLLISHLPQLKGERER